MLISARTVISTARCSSVAGMPVPRGHENVHPDCVEIAQWPVLDDACVGVGVETGALVSPSPTEARSDKVLPPAQPGTAAAMLLSLRSCWRQELPFQCCFCNVNAVLTALASALQGQ